MPQIKKISQNKYFDGFQYVYAHEAESTACTMSFGIFLPPQTEALKSPVLYWLSGLTCTEQNFITKSGAQRIAAETGMILIIPDTSPRGVKNYDDTSHENIGAGAGFYLNATQNPWHQHYQMETYITKELPLLLEEHFPIDNKRVGIFGHSMGGHGALTLALKNQNYYKSVSAFAPITSLSRSPWGENVLSQYIGENRELWAEFDASLLVEQRGWKGPSILIDQGMDDPFIERQLKPQLFSEACERANVSCQLRLQEGYDHSYFFISSFIEEHIRYHSSLL
jgi:S-formylglutathione hydrolase